MTALRNWTERELAQISASAELTIAVPRRDGGWRAAVPIWVVTAGGSVYVRTWRRRETGWYSGALRSGEARVTVPGLEVHVSVTDVSGDPAVRAAVDDAYRRKYGGGSGSDTVSGTVTDDAARTTLRLSPRA